MSAITRDVVIAAPVADVWALLEDVRRLPEFSSSTVAVRDAPERIARTGETYVQVGRILGKTYESTWQVVAFDPPRRIASEGSLGHGVRYCLTQCLTAVDDTHTRLTIQIDYSVPGGLLGRLAAKAGVEAQAAREAQAVLDGIRRVVETSVRGGEHRQTSLPG